MEVLGVGKLERGKPHMKFQWRVWGMVNGKEKNYYKVGLGSYGWLPKIMGEEKEAELYIEREEWGSVVLKGLGVKKM